ncbi:hypothetical protein RCJ22_11920 [Vibrio sp. FNV 38]|nr:hypothetical protein [Vibrio sp. FNV 38]
MEFVNRINTPHKRLKLSVLISSALLAVGCSSAHSQVSTPSDPYTGNPIPTEWAKPDKNGNYDCSIPAERLKSFENNKTDSSRWETDLTGYGCKEVAFVKDPYTDPKTGKLVYDGRDFGEVGFFEDKIGDDVPGSRTLNRFADEIFDNSDERVTALTKQLNRDFNWASKQQGGSVIRIMPNKNGQNRIPFQQLFVQSNVRVEVHPDVIIEMVPTTHWSGNLHAGLFNIGGSPKPNNLIEARVENVEITTMKIPGREGDRFTVDSRTRLPFNYGQMYISSYAGVTNLTRSIAIKLFYAKNFKISNMNVLDNYTESVAVQMFSDADYQESVWAYRDEDISKDVFLENKYVSNPNDKDDKTMYKPGTVNIPLKTNDQGKFIDDNGNVVPDMFAILRNPSYGRTPIKGTIENIYLENAHTGYGAVQVYGGDWIEINNIKSHNGIGVRIETGNGTNRDKFNQAGPYLTSASRIKISDVEVTDGFTGVWLKTHAKIMKDIYVENVHATDTATAVLVEKGTFACKTNCRDLTRGRINGLTIKGDIVLEQTKFDEPTAQVGKLATFFMTPYSSEYFVNKLGKASISELSHNDSRIKVTDNSNTPQSEWPNLTPDDFDVPAGSRWYKIFPVAPILASAEYSSEDTGMQSADFGYFPVDTSLANIEMINVMCSGYDGSNEPKGELCTDKIKYRSDVVYPNQTLAADYRDK